MSYNNYEQKFFEEPPVLAIGEAHKAVGLLLDTSSSTSVNGANEQINLGVKNFVRQCAADEQTAKQVDVAVVTFDSEVKVRLPFTPIAMADPEHFSAQGETDMDGGIRQMISMVTERSKEYERVGTASYVPDIVMMTDGHPFKNGNRQSVKAIAKEIHRLEAEKKLKFWALGVTGADFDVLRELAGDRVFELEGYDFTGFFNWLSMTYRNVTRTNPGDEVEVPPLPPEVKLKSLFND